MRAESTFSGSGILRIRNGRCDLRSSEAAKLGVLMTYNAAAYWHRLGCRLAVGSVVVGEGTDQCSRGGCGPRNMETQHGKAVRSANRWNPQNNQVLPSVRSPGFFAAGSPPFRFNPSFQAQPKNLLAVFNAAFEFGLLTLLLGKFCVFVPGNGKRLLRRTM